MTIAKPRPVASDYEQKKKRAQTVPVPTLQLEKSLHQHAHAQGTCVNASLRKLWWLGEVEVALFDGVGCVYLLAMYEEYVRLGQGAFQHDQNACVKTNATHKEI